MSNNRKIPSSIDKRFLDSVEQGDFMGAKAALADGADLQARTGGENNALCIAVNRQNHAMADWLLSEGVEWRIINGTARTPMLDAARNGDLAMVELLLQHQVDPNWPPRDDGPPLGGALSNGQRGFMALHQAAVDGNLPITKALLAAGADQDIQTRMLGRPLYFAVVNCNADVMAALLAQGGNPNGVKMELKTEENDEPVYYRQSVLFNLCEQRHIPMLRMCLDAGADVTRTNEHGENIEQYLAAKTPGRERVLAVYDEYRKMPELDDAALADITRERLFTTNEHGYCLMDSPSTWRRFDELREALEKAGDPLTAADMEQGGKTADSWLERGVRCFAADTALDCYVQAGGSLTDALLDGRAATPLSKAVFETQQVGAATRSGLWMDAEASKLSFRAFCAQIPEVQKVDIDNYFFTLSALEESKMGIGR